jgi:Secretion system C-terminal sorting domain
MKINLQHTLTKTTHQHGAFPMCDHNGMLYTETDIANASDRAFIAAFPKSGELLWSTQYGNGNGNSAVDICANSQLVWMVGSSSRDWTFVDFNDNSDEDYFREILDPNDPALPEATIARFDIPQIVGTQEMTSQNNNHLNAIFLFPNPSDGRITIDLRSSGIEGRFEIKVINSLGQITKAEQHTATEGFLEYDVSELAPGVYQMVFLANEITYSTSFVKN